MNARDLLRECARIAVEAEPVEDCERCGDPVDEDARCTHGRQLCALHLTACQECRADFADDERLSR